MRVDAHHHLWDLDQRPQPWMTDEMGAIRRSFGVDDLERVTRPCRVDATVVVQTVEDEVETVELLTIAGATPLVAGVVGYVDVSARDVGDRLDRLVAHPAGGALVGVRSLVQYQPDPGWLARPEVLAGLREVARRGLAFDLLIRHDQFDGTVTAVAAVDSLRFVLDHLAKPAIARRGWEPWATGVAALAGYGHVMAKLSGLVTEADWSSWSCAELRPYVDHAIDHFTPDRLMFGSDWPVCTLAAAYPEVVSTVGDLIARLSPDEQTSIWGHTAVATYGLDSRNPALRA